MEDDRRAVNQLLKFNLASLLTLLCCDAGKVCLAGHFYRCKLCIFCVSDVECEDDRMGHGVYRARGSFDDAGGRKAREAFRDGIGVDDQFGGAKESVFTGRKGSSTGVGVAARHCDVEPFECLHAWETSARLGRIVAG